MAIRKLQTEYKYTCIVYLLQSEDKKFVPSWNIDGCLLAVEYVLKQQYFPATTKDTLKVFMGRQVTNKNGLSG